MTPRRERIQVNLKVLLISTGVLAILSFKSVLGASCSGITNGACDDSEFTTSTCENGVCRCKSGFPIPSGCSKNLPKPTIKLSDSSRTNLVKLGENAALVCFFNSSDENLITSFQWTTKINTTIEQTRNSYNIIAASDSTVGTFRCKALYNSNAVSEDSDPYIMSVYVKGKFNLSLSVTDVPEFAASGVSYTPKCSGLPFGVEPVFTISENNKQETPITSFVASDAKQGQLKCSFDDFTSPLVNTTTIVTNITSVEVKVVGFLSLEYIFKTGTKVQLYCVTKPSEDLMGGKAKMSYTFTDNNVKLNTTDSKEYVPPSSGNHTISCSASYNSLAPVPSNPITITFSDSYTGITTPVLTASGTNLLRTSRLVFKCGSHQGGVTYDWIVNTSFIPFQHDYIIQIDNVGDADAGNYSCKIRTKNYELISNIVIISIAENISQPIVKDANSQTVFYEADNYTLECRTASMTTGMNYTWKRNGTALNSTAMKYSITIMTSKDAGDYTCQVIFQNKTSDSTKFTVSLTTAAGKPCFPVSAQNDCQGNGYKGTCSATKPYRCECKDPYKPKDKTCQKGTATVSSVVVLVIGVIFSRLM